jgi:hypothetical protein
VKYRFTGAELAGSEFGAGNDIIGGIWSEQWPLGNSQYWSSPSHVARRSRLLRGVAVVAVQVLVLVAVLAQVPGRAQALPVDRSDPELP